MSLVAPEATDQARRAPRSGYRHEARTIVRLAIPLIAGQLAFIGTIVADTVMAGRLGATDLAAVGLAASLWAPVWMVLMGTCMALSPSVAQLVGRGEQLAAGRVVRQGLWLGLALGLLGIAVVTGVARVPSRLGIEPDVALLAAGYLHVLVFALPASGLYLALRFSVEGTGATRLVLYVAIGALVAKLFVNWLLMFGALGAPRLGAVGAAWSTVVVLWLNLASIIVWSQRNQWVRALGIWHQFEPPDPRALLRLFKLGLPIAGAFVAEVGLFSAVTLMMGQFGATALSAHQIAYNVSSITFMVPLGIAMATTVRVGSASTLGPEAARRAGVTGMSLAVAAMAVASVVLVLTRGSVAALYTDVATVQVEATALLLLAALFQLSDGLQVSSAGALRGIKDTGVPFLITAVSYWGVGVPAAFLLGFTLELGAQGLWLGLFLGLTTAGLLLSRRFIARTNGRGLLDPAMPSTRK